MTAARIGVIGCGNVSHLYHQVLAGISSVEVAAITDLDPTKAKAIGEQYGVPVVDDTERLLADPSIELVLNLTPITAHVQTTRDALAAGKHVYSEKPLATGVTEARSLIEEADRRGLRLACAPDTLLGTGFQAAYEALSTGRIGRPLNATATMQRNKLASPTFYTVGTTPIVDMAPYYLSALVNLFGPATAVSSTMRTWPGREVPPDPEAGPSIGMAGIVEFATGMLATLTMAWGTEHFIEVPAFTVSGTTGTLQVPNPNTFGDPAYVQPYGEEPVELEGSRQQSNGWSLNFRGIGLADQIQAIRTGRRPRAAADLACHVVDLITGLERSATTGERVELTTTCTPAEPLAAAERDRLLA